MRNTPTDHRHATAWAVAGGLVALASVGLLQIRLATVASHGGSISTSDLGWSIAVPLALAAVALVLGALLRRSSLTARHADAVLRSGADPLTGLGGHRLFREELARRAGAAVRRARPFSLALVDVDRFADLNAAEGLRHGDRVLAEIGAVLRSGRSEDLPYRVGGDRFAILLPHTDAAEAAVPMERVRAAVKGGLRGVTASIGIAELDHASPGAGDLLARAELALEDAKAAGRDRVVVFHAPAAAGSTRRAA
jgi:diguanylate cyclase (GGDEF)-like protein